MQACPCRFRRFSPKHGEEKGIVTFFRVIARGQNRSVKYKSFATIFSSFLVSHERPHNINTSICLSLSDRHIRTRWNDRRHLRIHCTCANDLKVFSESFQGCSILQRPLLESVEDAWVLCSSGVSREWIESEEKPQRLSFRRRPPPPTCCFVSMASCRVRRTPELYSLVLQV